MEKHNAIIKGSVYKLRYYLFEQHIRGLYNPDRFKWVKGSKKDFVKWDEIWNGEINSPLLEVGELFYIEDLEVKVRISERIRTTSGSYIYETDHVVEVIEDEETKESEENTDKELEKYNEIKVEKEIEVDSVREREYQENLSYLRSKTEPKEKRSWFERLFG